MSRLALYFFGTPRIELDGVPVSLSHNKAVAFLAYLSLTRQHHTRLALAALLWPDYDPANARRELRRIMWVVNKQLGPEWLALDHQAVSLPLQPDLWLDVAQFRELLVECKQHGHPVTAVCPACLEPLTQAVALAQGELLAGFTLPDSPDFDIWQTFETESLQRELFGALERLVQLLAQGGADTIEQAITYARHWLALDPLHEPAQRQLMQLYAWSGQSAAALQQYKRWVDLLDQELGLSPAAETTALFEAIKTNRLPPPPGPTASPPVVTSASIAPPAARPLPHNLPPQSTPFIGREAALDNLQQRLNDPAVRLITIVGPGGIGKTRLALALAMRHLEPAAGSGASFPDGIYFIALAPLSSADIIAQTIAAEIALPLTSTQEPAAQLLTYLRHRRMLLILDNFEHVLSGTSLVSDLLQTAAGVKVVATSRERLNLANEILWPISGLNFAELPGVEEALGYEAVRLFVQCARRVRPDFVLHAEDLPHLERLLQGVWGMPLAIELAATWLNMLSVAEIAAELSHNLDFLDANMRDMPERHRSMRAVFDHSWRLLSVEEQQVLRRLSVFKGGFRRDAAEAVAGANLRILSRLLNKSLLRRSTKGHYDLHELIRQFAAERLHTEIQEEPSTRDRHSHYYLTLLQLCEPALTSRRQIETLAELNAEIDNLRTAWYWTVDRQQVDLMRRAAWSLWYFYELRNYSQEGEAALRRAGEMVQALRVSLGATSPEQERAKLAGALGELQAHQAFFSLRQGHQSQTKALFESSISLLRPLQEPAMLAHALAHYGAFYWNIGQFDQAADCLTESLEISRAFMHPWQLAIFTSFMGVVVHEQGKY
ncbi:MAG: AAA family ATPase, partial [Anaerolineae bacterium]|nr:AAA family ATPase [Anaerolineae bacterium]